MAMNIRECFFIVTLFNLAMGVLCAMNITENHFEQLRINLIGVILYNFGAIVGALYPWGKNVK